MGLDLCPDPMLLLVKAATNWSWWCGQQLLPACGLANEEEEKEEEVVRPSTLVPTEIEVKPVPVTPDDEDDLSVWLLVRTKRGDDISFEVAVGVCFALPKGVSCCHRRIWESMKSGGQHLFTFRSNMWNTACMWPCLELAQCIAGNHLRD